MKFRNRPPEEPEINLIPFIDVLLVILIFLMLTTTYSKFTELQVNLPVANADAAQERPREIIIAVSADGRYAINQQPIEQRSTEAIANALHGLADKDAVLIVSADAAAPMQSVVTAMDAARREGLIHITFATQSGSNP